MAKTTKRDERSLNLALQGGGAHGAFGWGVIDRLLEEDDLAFEGLSGTSAGAVNAVVLAQGLMDGGKAGARRALDDFWQKISRAGSFWSPVNTTSGATLPGMNLVNAAAYSFFDILSRTFSPYEINPLGFNPLKSILADTIDFAALQKHAPVQLFISATNVREGRVRVFETPEVSADVVMASACLPFLFQAVEIDGEAYWDGGYMGNPVLFPFFYKCLSRDVMIIHINPMRRETVPRSAPEIMNRINEISFNSSLVDEFRAINFVTKLIEEDWLKDEYKERLRHILVHSVRADTALADLTVASKFDVSWPFLSGLKARGRDTADEWLRSNKHAIGKRSTVNLAKDFLGLP